MYDQIVFYVCQSFLVEVQNETGYILCGLLLLLPTKKSVDKNAKWKCLTENW